MSYCINKYISVFAFIILLILIIAAIICERKFGLLMDNKYEKMVNDMRGNDNDDKNNLTTKMVKASCLGDGLVVWRLSLMLSASIGILIIFGLCTVMDCMDFFNVMKLFSIATILSWCALYFFMNWMIFHYWNIGCVEAIENEKRLSKK